MVRIFARSRKFIHRLRSFISF